MKFPNHNLWRLVLSAAYFLSFFPLAAQAQNATDITDWIIRDFKTVIEVQSDSSLVITESIIADCDDLPGKHGIFRVVPTQTRTEKGTIKTTVSLISITDFDGNELDYSVKIDNFRHTVGWQIGDPARNVTGENRYRITYAVKNAIRSGNGVDEFYWNLSGNFWDIEVDRFDARVIFPQGVAKDNTETYIYSGPDGEKSNRLAYFEWLGNILHVAANGTLAPGQGVTASVTFPKGIVTPYAPGFWEKYGDWLWFVLPLFALAAALWVWVKYGKDPRVDKTIIPEFEIPESLTPMELGLLANEGYFADKFISAAIINLAVKKYLSIEEVEKHWSLGASDFKLIQTAPDAEFLKLDPAAKMLADEIFKNGSEIKLSELKNRFYTVLPSIKKAVAESLKAKELVHQSGFTFRAVLLAIAGTTLIAMCVAIGIGEFYLAGALGLSAAILLVFGLVMPKRTQKGALLNWRVKGFRLYMETAEKYRSQFYEKENIFEKFLPYAIVFGIAKLWAKKMEEIYGKEYFAAYHPAWYIGSSVANFNADSFASGMTAVSAGIAASAGTASGAHGSGVSGGGGGGGGGGGW
ncbi:MAG: DUF2207 domain-containing protein [Candidatus Pacebacteria bacterium]|jgi:uncharacterized membrane protein|nr:DUF2207 domain-containing protein [Candidatus Paceibacterota bacterium]